MTCARAILDALAAEMRRMTGTSSRRAFQALLVVLAGIAVIAGMATVLFGVDSIIGAEAVSATVDSEMRFYAVWYVGAGVLLAWSAANLERSGGIVRGVAALLFLGGLSRALSWISVGEPHNLSVVLMVIELTLPTVIVAWQAARKRRASS